MQDVLLNLTTIAILFFIGILCTTLSKKVKIPHGFLLILAGILLSQFSFHLQTLLLPDPILTTIGLLTLTIILFNSCINFKFSQIDILCRQSIASTLLLGALLLIFFSIASNSLLQLPLWTCIFFAALIIGITQETLISTPLAIILPLLIFDFANTSSLGQLPSFLIHLAIGIGCGLFVGIILFKLLSKISHENYAPLALIATALLSYALAENLGGFGIFAIATLGLFLGNLTIKIPHLNSPLLQTTLSILCYLPLGLIVSYLPLSSLITSAILFFVFLAIAFFSRMMITHSIEQSLQFHLTDGLSIAAILLSLHSSLAIQPIIVLCVAILLYASLLSYANHHPRHQLPH